MRKPLRKEDLERIVDGQGTRIDEKIIDLVAAVNLYVPTTASCEGHYDHGLPFPWVDVYDREDNFSTLEALLKSWNKTSKIPWVLYRYMPSEAEETIEKYAREMVRKYGAEDGITLEKARRICRDSLHTRRLAPVNRTNWPLPNKRKFVGSIEYNARDLGLECVQDEAMLLARFLTKQYKPVQ